MVNDDNKIDVNELLRILIRSAPINLREIRLFDYITFSLEILGEFFEKWRGRHSLSILTCDSTYIRNDYVELIEKYKNDGVIKDFRYVFRNNLYFSQDFYPKKKTKQTSLLFWLIEFVCFIY